MSDRPIAGRWNRKESSAMTAQMLDFKTDLLGPFPAYLLILVLLLTLLGVVAHVAFA